MLKFNLFQTIINIINNLIEIKKLFVNSMDVLASKQIKNKACTAGYKYRKLFKTASFM